MPYMGEYGSKTGHASFVKNRDVDAFLSQCHFMSYPGEDESRELVSHFQPAPVGGRAPRLLVACDGSAHCAPVNETRLPSAQIGYVKASLSMIRMDDFSDLVSENEPYVDPFKVAELHRRADAVSIVLPGSNIVYGDSADVASGFRRAIFEQCDDDRTNWVKGERFSIADSLFDFCGDNISLSDCPRCRCQPKNYFQFARNRKKLQCEECGIPIYVTDIFRLHEDLSDFGDNKSAMIKFMNVFEHLLVASLVNMLFKKNRETLSGMAFLIDGPLAIFGLPSKLSRRLMGFYERTRRGMIAEGLDAPTILGVQKNGALVDHARFIEPHLAPETFALIDDDYRRRYVQNIRRQSDNFGHDTYYGQDFIFKTGSGRVFAFSLPYPYEKKDSREKFARIKTDLAPYMATLKKALEIIRLFECELYADALAPVVLAHRHASISFVPGGNVLNLLARMGVNRKQ